MSTAYDALLVLSFGGPEHPDHVRPFLENVVRGRGVPPERLDAVEQHYLRFGGVSPINEQNRSLIAAVSEEFGRRGRDLPVYFGNRNWHPMVEDTVQTMKDDGVRDALVFATSAWGGFSGCRQYDEDIARALAAVVIHRLAGQGGVDLGLGQLALRATRRRRRRAARAARRALAGAPGAALGAARGGGGGLVAPTGRQAERHDGQGRCEASGGQAHGVFFSSSMTPCA